MGVGSLREYSERSTGSITIANYSNLAKITLGKWIGVTKVE